MVNDHNAGEGAQDPGGIHRDPCACRVHVEWRLDGGAASEPP